MFNPMMGPLGASMDNPLAQALGKLQANTLGGGGVTLGNEQAQQDYTQQMAQALAQMQSAASQQSLGESMMAPEYVQNSGLLGSLAMMAQAAAGKKMTGRAAKDDASAREAYYKGEAGAKAEQEARDAKRKQEESTAEMARREGILRSGDPYKIAAAGLTAPKQDGPEYDLREVGGKLYYVPKQPMGQQPVQQRNSPAADAGFDTLRAAVEWQESRGNPNAVSPKGARGRMQTMPGTLRDPGYGITPAADNSDAEMTRVGTEYLKAMTDKYGPIGGLAAYNWGPGNWEKALQQSGGDPERALSMAPKETQDYVPSVLGRVGAGGGAGVGFGLPEGAIPVPGLPENQSPQVRTLSPAEIRSMGLPAGTVAQMKPDGSVSVVNKPDAPKAAEGGPKLTAEGATKLALIDNAIRPAKEWHKLVVNSDGSFNDIKARTPQAMALLTQAIRSKLRAESGATITPDEVEGEVARYLGGFFSSDSTNSQQAGALISDLTRQRDAFTGATPAAGGSPERVRIKL